MSALRDARTGRGWSQGRLVMEIERCAERGGVSVMSRSSLKTALSRWENGHVTPEEYYRRLLRDVLELSDTDLGFATEHADPTHADLIERITRARKVDAELVQMFRQQTDALRRLDRRLGAPALLAQMNAHIGTMQDLLSHTVSEDVRRHVASALADASPLAGWQALDVGAMNRAWSNFETAKSAARESGDVALLTHAQAEQAYILLDLGQVSDAYEATNAAQAATTGHVSPLITSWLHAANAEMAAAAGEESAARRSLDIASDALPQECTDPNFPYISLDAHHLDRWQGSILARLGAPEALDVLTLALDGMDPDFNRARGSLHIDLATVYRALDVEDQAVAHITAARSCSTQVGSQRQRRRLEALAA